MKLLITAFTLVPRTYHKKGLVLVILLLIHSLLDFFSLAIFVPVLFTIVNPNIVASNSDIAEIFNFFGFASHATFVVTLTAAVFIFLLLRNLFSIWMARLKARYAFHVGKDLAANELERYSRMNYIGFAKTDFAKELSRITNYPTAFAHNILLPLMSLLSEGVVSVLILFCMAIYDFRVLALLFVILIPIIGLYLLRKKNLEKINDDLKEKYPLLVKHALRIIEGFAEIRVYGKQLFFKDKFQRANESLTEAHVKDQVMQSATIRLAELVVGMVICFLIIYSVSTARGQQETLFLLGVYAGASFRIIPSVNRMMLALQQIRIHEYTMAEIAAPVPQPTVTQPVDKLRFEEKIELQNISFAYTDAARTLRQASLTVRKGEKIAITGKSGQGKTTILLILLRFLQESEGQILVDGKRISNENEWLPLIGYVPQSPYILDGSLLENIAFGVAREKMDSVKAERLMHELELDDLLKQLPDGMDTKIGERGVQLSGGQRQRVALARALYADAEILLLDEVTNQLHESLEQEIWNVLNNQSKKRKTIIVITHKLSQVNFFDAIYRLENGRLHEAVMQS